MVVSQEEMDEIMAAAAEAAGVEDVGDLSDGHHTFNDLYYQRLIEFATLVGLFPELSWKTRRHDDGELCFGDGDKSYDGFLDRYIPDLKAAYEKAVKEYTTTGKAKAIEVGNSYDRVPKDLVPGLTTLYTVWPRPEARGARYQRECSLYMAIGPRDKFKF